MSGTADDACGRCQGLLVLEWIADLLVGIQTQTRYCIQCGGRSDPTLEANKARPHTTAEPDDKPVKLRRAPHRKWGALS